MTEPTKSESKARRPRVPNAERSAMTRAKLVEATIQVLAERGYHQLTTVLVAARAGVSRGAMLHHFPTKADLVMAAAQEMTQMRGELHRERLKKYTSAKEAFLRLIDVLWEAMQTPSGIARIELMLSTRSDPELAERFKALNDELDQRHKEGVWRIAEAMGLDRSQHGKQVDTFVQLYAAALRGLAIDAVRPASRAGASDAVELLKRMQRQFVEDLFST